MTRFASQAIVVVVIALVIRSASASNDAELADSYKLQTTNLSASIKTMHKVIDASPNAYFPRLRLAYLSSLNGAPAGAVAGYRAAAKLAPGAIEPLLGEQLALITLGKWDDAEAVAKHILAIDAANYLARSRLAWTRYKTKDFRGAAELYAAILVQYPGDTEMRNGLGWSLLSLGRKDDAAAAFREVLTMVPKQAGATEGLAAAGR
jgi:tetratricopeptide (TPR) repeat protein